MAWVIPLENTNVDHMLAFHEQSEGIADVVNPTARC